ncbi:helix-turn-helix domain-containing protein [Phenylobacterium sp.]|uniref:helix-turn-helix domain-containing protein n=1 Tax=Phenylobacterium sp. TaxID=1871053 RepID=UPI002F3F3CE8
MSGIVSGDQALEVRIMADGGDRRTLPPASTDALLNAAAELAAPAPGHAASPALESFSSLYLDWILLQRGMSRRTADRREKSSLMLSCLVSAKSLGEALQLYGRFAKLLWGDAWLTEVRDAGESLELVFTPPLKADDAGLISDLWDLARVLCELEWLVGGPLDGVTGRARNPMLIEPATAALLFGRPLTCGASELALSVPRRHLGRGIVARARDIDRFCASLPLTTLAGAARRRPDLRTLVASLIRKDRLQTSPEPTTLTTVAARLGRSPATLRRQLRAEGAGFREISEAVQDDLARGWLADSALTIESIADRLGYSDAFAFRRWFRRRNGCSPSAFRRAGELRSPCCPAGR